MSKLLLCNTKMNLATENILSFLEGIQKINYDNLVVSPSIIYTPFFVKKKFGLCNQYFSVYSDGDHTGGISINQIKGLGCQYALIGHLDLNDKEDSSIINKKIKMAIKNGLKPIVCVGETLEEKNMLKTERVLKKQVLAYLRDIPLDNVIIAYNPGYKLTIRDREDVAEVITFIKNIIDLNFKYDKIKVLCGDITDKNIKAYSELQNLDGFVTSSIDVSCIKNIVEVICE